MSYLFRGRNSLAGLAIGDALSWPAFYHRTYTLPFWTRRLRREIDVFQEGQGIIRYPMPFSLNRPTEHLQLSPTDDTEWAAFTAKLIISCQGNLTRQVVASAWQQLAREEGIRGSISVQGALHNLKKGLTPPITGKDNPHYFDDAACSRAVVIGVAFAKDSKKALQMAEIDAEVTNSRDGLWAAKAIAAAVATACGGASLERTVKVALDTLPQDSWVRRVSEQALDIADQHQGIAVIPKLDLLVNKEYSYGGAAPEVLALTLALLRVTEGEMEKGITYALGFPKLADSLGALVGALCGALSPGKLTTVAEFEETIKTLQGVCLPTLEGQDYLGIVDELLRIGEQMEGE